MAASRRRRSRKRTATGTQRRRTLLKLLGLGVLLPALAWLVLFAWGFFPDSSSDLGPRSVTIGSSDPGTAADALARAGLAESPRLLALYLTLVTPSWSVAVRQHWLPGGRSPRQLALALAERGGEAVRVALPEGKSSFDLGQRLERARVCQAAGFLNAAQDAALLADFGIQGRSAEGFLFPESHEVRLDERPERVVRRFLAEGAVRHRALREKYPLTDEHRALGLGWSEIVTLASMVERETARPEERPRIARVFLNRLLFPQAETGGRLESDPTAAYGCLALGAEAPPTCAQARGGVTPALLRDASNPYSTYRRAGLPPGPVGNPGEAALVAVLRPAPGEELYFVADGQGNHHFSRTFAEHHAAVERLRAVRRTAVPDERAVPGE